MNNCELLNALEVAIKKNESIEKIMPYDLEGLDYDLYMELLAIYITYGEDPKRREICKRKWERETRRHSL